MKNGLTIGVLGGMGTYATIHFFQQYAEVFPAVKEWDRPRIVIDNRCTMPSRVRAFLYNEKVCHLVEEMSDSLQGLLRAGCNKIFLACNTAHLFLPQIYQKIPELKGAVVNIIDVCVKNVANDNIKEVYLLGTEGTIDSRIYQDALSKFGIKCIAPRKDEYDRLRDCIEAVKQNRFSDKVMESFLELVNRYPACILGCTELPILYEKYRDSVSCEKVFDPLQLSLYELKSTLCDVPDAELVNSVWDEKTGITADTYRSRRNACDTFAEKCKDEIPEVIRFNADAISDVMQLSRVHLASAATADALTLLHFSDIHGDELCLKNIQIVKNEIQDHIDDAICTGDLVQRNWSSSFDFWNRGSDGSILVCIGNHDVILAEAAEYSLQPPEVEIYNRYIAAYIKNWGANVSHTNTNLYYYKDYPVKKFRLIVLNAMYSDERKVAEQNVWLSNVLTDANGKDYSVIIAEHYYPDEAQKINCTFSSLTRFPAGTMQAHFQNRITDYQSIVQNFIEAGGDFVCYLCGHRHADYIAYTNDYKKQTFIGVGGALCYENLNISEYDIGGDARRISGEKSMDCFNVISFDRNAHYIKIVRIGCDRDLYMRHRGTLVLDYSTSPATVVYND